MVGDDVMQTDSKRNSILRELLKEYATRAREFSDEVARLGAYEQGRTGPEFLGLLAEIKRRQVLCISSGEDLYRYVAAENPGALLPVAGQEPDPPEKDINEIRQENMAARERYKKAEEEFRSLTAQAHDIGLNHPDGVEAMRMATRRFNAALRQYRIAIGKLRECYHRDTGREV